MCLDLMFQLDQKNQSTWNDPSVSALCRHISVIRILVGTTGIGWVSAMNVAGQHMISAG